MIFLGGVKGWFMLLPDEVKENRNVFKVFCNYALWSFLFIFLIFIYIWQSIIVSDLEYNIKNMEKKIILLSKDNKKMETEVSFLSSAERIKGIAENKLKLIPVNQEDIIWIDCNYDNKKLVKAKKE